MRRRALPGDVGSSTLVALAAALAMVGASSCIDASHDDQVQALGSDAPGVPNGPDHRPGQPCLVCHGGLGPASAQFVLAGTVYAVQGETHPSSGARVQIEDAKGSFYTSITNGVGNFYITPDQWSPAFPATITVSQGQDSQQMMTNIGRDGSCAACHTPSPGPTSPGPVYVAAGALPEAGP